MTRSEDAHYSIVRDENRPSSLAVESDASETTLYCAAQRCEHSPARSGRVPHTVWGQVELSPFLQQRELRAFCREHGIRIEAYSPLTKGLRLQHPEVVRIAKALHRTAAQVLIRWGLQHELVVLPKSSQPARLQENLAALDFVLDAEHMAALDGLEEGLVTGWDPRQVP